MKKIGISLIFVLLLALFVTGCNQTPEQPSANPTLEELIEINDLENVFKDHTSVYVNIESKTPTSDGDYTEEVIYLKGDAGLCYHKRSMRATDTSYAYTSFVGNAQYYTDDMWTMSIMVEGDDVSFDYTLDFRSTPIGKGYIENGQIVYHTYYIYEADEMFDASRDDYTLYFNPDTKLLERMDYVSYDADHQVSCEYSSTISYDVENAENKFDKTAYGSIMSREDLIDLEIIANVGTPEQTSYSFVTVPESQIIAAFNDVTYLLYADPECQTLIETLDAYKGEKNLTLYAKIYEMPELPPVDAEEIPSFEELLEINTLENLFQEHTNAYVYVQSNSPTDIYAFTEEVIYLKDDTGFSTHKRTKLGFEENPWYTSRVGNVCYYLDDEGIVAILCEGEDPYGDHTLDFESTPIGKGYIENGQIIYHTYYITEDSEMFDASRTDLTLYFNQDTKHIEGMNYVTYNADHQVEIAYFLTVSYDVENVEDKMDAIAYKTIMNREDLIRLEIIENVGTPEQKSYDFVTATDSEVYAEIGGEEYLLYSDSAYQNEIETLDAYKGEKSLTLYAKKMELAE